MKYENINNSNLDGMSLASFCQSRAVLCWNKRWARPFIPWWYSVIDFLIVNTSISKLLHSWLFIDPSEHHYTTQNFFNRSSTMLNNVFNPTAVYRMIWSQIHRRWETNWKHHSFPMHPTCVSDISECQSWRIQSVVK